MEKKNTDTARKIVGDNGRLGRAKMDFYPTPHNVTEELIKREVFNGNIWECACGKGDISEVFIKHGYSVKSTDANDHGYGVVGVDFLNDNSLFTGTLCMEDNIVTNPPYALALEFINQAKRYARFKVAMFLKTAFLEGMNRYAMFQDREFPLKCMYQFSKRVDFGKYSGTHENGGMIAFAWFVWERGFKDRPYIDWIHPGFGETVAGGALKIQNTGRAFVP